MRAIAWLRTPERGMGDLVSSRDDIDDVEHEFRHAATHLNDALTPLRHSSDHVRHPFCSESGADDTPDAQPAHPVGARVPTRLRRARPAGLARHGRPDVQEKIGRESRLDSPTGSLHSALADKLEHCAGGRRSTGAAR